MKIVRIIKPIILIVLAIILLIAGFKLISTLCTLSDEKSDLHELIVQSDQGENLFQKNSDMICQLEIKGTDINYPVMYTPDDPEYYLHRDFDGEYSYSGLPFLDSRCDIDKSSNLIIYGHNMKNKTMFSQLLNYEDYEFWKNHKYIDIKMPGGERKYEIIAAFKSEIQEKSSTAFRYYSFTDAKTSSEYDEYVQNIKKLALYDTGISSEYGLQLMTLSTCSYHTENGRFAVVAKKIE